MAAVLQFPVPGSRLEAARAAGRAMRLRINGSQSAEGLRRAGRRVRIALENAADDHAVASAVTDPRAERWHKKMLARDKSEARYAAAIRTALKEAEAHVMWNLAADDVPQITAVNAAGDILRAVFDLTKFTARLLMLTTKAAKIAIHEAADEFNDENGFFDDPWTMPDARVIEQVRAREPFIADAAKDIRDDISQVIEDGITRGDDLGRTAGRVQQKFGEISDQRAVTIARTETAIAYNNAQVAGMKAKGIEFKEWLSARDEQVRASHREIDGVVIGIDDTFEVRTKANEPPDRMAAPCDPAATPGNIINCRCCIIASRGPATS